MDAAGLFSRNEAIEDVPTEHLRFLLCRYLLGEVLLNTSTGERAAVLKGARSELRLYLRWCDDLGCMHEADREGLHREEAPDAATRRTEKIARFKAERALQAKVRCGRHKNTFQDPRRLLSRRLCCGALVCTDDCVGGAAWVGCSDSGGLTSRSEVSCDGQRGATYFPCAQSAPRAGHPCQATCRWKALNASASGRHTRLQ